MATTGKLKVYRTPIGFHDAYVAAPSQKAALQAWGSDTNLFAQGLAELVIDPALMAEPLASPGQVIRKLRGTNSEQFAALDQQASGATKKKTQAPKVLIPRPSRGALSDAEEALATVLARQQKELEQIEIQIAALERQRSALQRQHGTELQQVKARCAKEQQAYERALQRWRQS